MTKRTHLVLVPGFGGFDALGQIFYYADVSLSAGRWRERASKSGRPPLALHYFEGLPTAGVRTRAMALRAFLEERELRGIFDADDRIALLGHSTGGLDIRQLLVNIGFGAFEPSYRDNLADKLADDEKLRARMARLVFLSVPQRGTNIADFIRHLRGGIRLGLGSLERYLGAQHQTRFERVEAAILKLFPSEELKPQLLAAIRDAADEMLAPRKPHTPTERYQAALARAAYGELTGWLDNVETDFFAIDDLAIEGSANAAPTPARYSEIDRKRELEAWSSAAIPIQTLSFATLGRRPYDKDPDTSPRLLAELAHVARAVSTPDTSAHTDFVYRFAYAATAAGPFQINFDASVTDNGAKRVLRAFENDGIANTASMLWPNGPNTRLVHADHGDIIGHYRRSDPIRASERISGRQSHSYDIFRSNSGFKSRDDFDHVWHEIFDFVTG